MSVAGTGSLFDDLKLADQLYATIVRSRHAHADIITIDTEGQRRHGAFMPCSLARIIMPMAWVIASLGTL